MKKALILAQEPITVICFLLPLIEKLKVDGYEVNIVCKESEKINVIREYCNVIPLFIKRTLNPKSVLQTYKELKTIFKSEMFDLLITQTPIISFISRISLHVNRPKKIIYLAHGLPFMKGMSRHKYLFYYFLEKIAGIFTDILICMNEEDYRTASAKKIIKDTSKIYKINGIGVDNKKYNPSKYNRKLILEKLNIKENEKIILFSGRLIEQKGIIEYLNLAGYLKNEHNLKFVIMGYGILEKYVVDYIRDNNLINTIYLGFRDDADQIMSVTDILVLPSSYPEGMPRVILEAMSMGKVVITTNNRGCIDLIKDGVNGFITDKNDYKETANKILYLFKNPDIYDQMSSLNTNLIERNYSEEIIMENIMKIIKD